MQNLEPAGTKSKPFGKKGNWKGLADRLSNSRGIWYCSAVMLVGCVLSGGIPTACAQSEDAQIRLADDVVVRKLAEGVWLHTTLFDISGLRRVPANGLIVIDGQNAVMIDLPWTDEQTGVLFDWAAREHNAQIGKVVATHSHIDCAGGLAEAHRRGGESFVLDKTAEILKREGKPAPGNWFSERMSLGCGDMRVELAFPGGGHTIDNIVVWIPARKVLFGGCLIKSANAGNLGNTTEGDLAAYPVTLKKVKETYSNARIVVPGHGRPGGMELVDHTITLCGKKGG